MSAINKDELRQIITDTCRTTSPDVSIDWTLEKPAKAGAYWVRGWNLEPGKQNEQALITVKYVDGELCSDLHGSNSDRHRVFTPVTQHWDRMQWYGPLSAADQQVGQAVPEDVQSDSAETVKPAYIRHFGSDVGWLDLRGSWFIEGYRAARAAPEQPPTDLPPLDAPSAPGGV